MTMNICEETKDVAPDPEKSIGDRGELRGKIVELEKAMLALPQIDIPIKHYFAPGLYLREMTMPAGSVVTGKIHKTEHLCVLAKGSVLVATEDGNKRFDAPSVVHSMPGTKRALHALSDVVWINVHHNPENEKDLEKIEAFYVTDSFEKFLEFTEQRTLEGEK